MAIKTYCDGCDKEIRFPDEDNKIGINIGSEITRYDLCDDCVKDHMHPRKWERIPLKSPRLTG